MNGIQLCVQRHEGTRVLWRHSMPVFWDFRGMIADVSMEPAALIVCFSKDHEQEDCSPLQSGFLILLSAASDVCLDLQFSSVFITRNGGILEV